MNENDRGTRLDLIRGGKESLVQGLGGILPSRRTAGEDYSPEEAEQVVLEGPDYSPTARGVTRYINGIRPLNPVDGGG